jgi:pimeloyl-ACP methyl ester carboxylesterase
MTLATGLLPNNIPFIRAGAGPRHAIVFFGANALFRPLDRAPDPRRYACQIARLLPHHRFTILGYPDSGLDTILPDLAAAIDAPPDLLLGISLGGILALRFAPQYPHLVKRLVLLVAAHRFSSEGRLRMDRQFDALARGDLLTIVRENALLFRRPWYNWLVRLKLRQSGPRITAGFRNPSAILRDYRQLFGPEFQRNAEYARRISAPTLVIGPLPTSSSTAPPSRKPPNSSPPPNSASSKTKPTPSPSNKAPPSPARSPFSATPASLGPGNTGFSRSPGGQRPPGVVDHRRILRAFTTIPALSAGFAYPLIGASRSVQEG